MRRRAIQLLRGLCRVYVKACQPISISYDKERIS
jgi:hypothetical protein